MSPDPPRSDEEIDSGTVYFMQGPDDEDDFMNDPNGEHALDFSDHESDFSDDDDNTNGQEMRADVNNEANGEPNQRMMARYQLLIPFPQAENHLESSDTENDPETQQPSLPPIISSFNSGDVPSNEIPQPTLTHENDDTGEPKREIILTDDKVEIIKNAMKGFTLPSASIPQWVDQVNENSWKEKLFESIHQNKS